MPGDLLRQRRVRLAGEHRNGQCIELSTLRHGLKFSGSFPIDESPPSQKFGWGGRIIRPCGPHPFGAARSGVILPQLTLPLESFPIDDLPPSPKVGWGGRIIRPCGPHPFGAARSGVILPQPTHALGPFSDRRIVPTTKIWLGWKDSNLRMAGSKPAALPLGDTPTWNQRSANIKLEPNLSRPLIFQAMASRSILEPKKPPIPAATWPRFPA